MLVAQRPANKAQPLMWEFPGGKLEDGELPPAALAREIREELQVDIEVGEALTSTTHDYGQFTITLHPYRATLPNGGEPHATEHVALRWCGRKDLEELDWADADVPIVLEYVKRRTDWFAQIVGTESVGTSRVLDSVWFDLFAFVLGLGIAWHFSWQTRDLVWSLWLASLVVGYSTIVIGIFSGVRRAESGIGALIGGLFILGFFTVHFGMFHFVHSAFLAGFFPLTSDRGFPSATTYILVLSSYWPWLLAAVIAERNALWEAWRGTSSTVRKSGAKPKPLDGFNPMKPYVNVIRMHLLIFFFAFTSFMGLENFLIYAVVYAVYFFPWRRVFAARAAKQNS